MSLVPRCPQCDAPLDAYGRDGGLNLCKRCSGDIMTEEQFIALEDFIQAKIDNEIERAFGRNATQETIREMDCRRAFRVVFDLLPLPDFKR